MAYRLSPTTSEADFLARIEKIVKAKNVSYYDATMQACIELKIAPEEAGNVIKKNPRMRFKIQRDADELHLLRDPRRKK